MTPSARAPGGEKTSPPGSRLPASRRPHPPSPLCRDDLTPRTPCAATTSPPVPLSRAPFGRGRGGALLHRFSSHASRITSHASSLPAPCGRGRGGALLHRFSRHASRITCHVSSLPAPCGRARGGRPCTNTSKLGRGRWFRGLQPFAGKPFKVVRIEARTTSNSCITSSLVNRMTV